MLCAICGSPMYAGGICPCCTLGYEEGKSQVAAADLRVEVQALRTQLSTIRAALAEAEREREAYRAVVGRACSMLDDAVQLRDDAEEWFPLIAGLRGEVGLPTTYGEEDCDE